MMGDGTSRKAGSFYDWRARPISMPTEKIEVSRAICDDLMDTVYEKFTFRPDYLTVMAAQDHVKYGNWLIEHGFIHDLKECVKCLGPVALQNCIKNSNFLTFRCTKKDCKARYPITAHTIFTQRHVSILDFLTFSMRWANGTPSFALERNINFQRIP